MKSKFDIKWDNTFDIVKEFVTKFGRFPNSTESFKDTNIGYWCYLQRYLFKNGRLKQWRINKLQSINFPFNVKIIVTMRNEVKWKNTFNLMIEFKERYGRLPYSHEKFKNVDLGTWSAYQRIKNKRNLLEQYKIDLLNSIEFIWNLDEYWWMFKYNLLKEYIEEFGKQPSNRTIYKNERLGSWCSTQRQIRKHTCTGSLTEERIQLLDKVNFRWD